MGGQDDVEPLSEVVGGYGSPGPYGTSVVGEYGTSVGRYGRIWELWASLWEDTGGQDDMETMWEDVGAQHLWDLCGRV